MVAPGQDAIVITPVCAHFLHFRPIVAGHDSHLRLTVMGQARVAADGDPIGEISNADSVEVCCSPRRVSFVRFEERNLFELIRQKLL